MDVVGLRQTFTEIREQVGGRLDPGPVVLVEHEDALPRGDGRRHQPRLTGHHGGCVAWGRRYARVMPTPVLYVHHRPEASGAAQSLALLIGALDKRFTPHVFVPGGPAAELLADAGGTIHTGPVSTFTHTWDVRYEGARWAVLGREIAPIARPCALPGAHGRRDLSGNRPRERLRDASGGPNRSRSRGAGRVAPAHVTCRWSPSRCDCGAARPLGCSRYRNRYGRRAFVPDLLADHDRPQPGGMGRVASAASLGQAARCSRYS